MSFEGAPSLKDTGVLEDKQNSGLEYAERPVNRAEELRVAASNKFHHALDRLVYELPLDVGMTGASAVGIGITASNVLEAAGQGKIPEAIFYGATNLFFLKAFGVARRAVASDFADGVRAFLESRRLRKEADQIEKDTPVLEAINTALREYENPPAAPMVPPSINESNIPVAAVAPVLDAPQAPTALNSSAAPA